MLHGIQLEPNLLETLLIVASRAKCRPSVTAILTAAPSLHGLSENHRHPAHTKIGPACRAGRSTSNTLCPTSRGLLDQTGLGTMTRQQLGRAFGNLNELVFKGFGDVGVKRPSRFAQERAVGSILYKSVLEQISRRRRPSAGRPSSPPSSSIQTAAGRSATAFDEIADLTARVSSRADDLEPKVAAFFSRVRAG